MTDIKFFFFFLVKRAGRHFGFFKRAGRHEKGAGRRALQKKPRQNTAEEISSHSHTKDTFIYKCSSFMDQLFVSLSISLTFP